MAFAFSSRSEKALKDLHPDLVRVLRHAIATSSIDFAVTEGKRSLARQKKLKAEGATTTLNSRHLTGHAADVAPFVNGEISWKWAHFQRLAKEVKLAAKRLAVPIVWGGDWRTFRDGPHFELDRRKYP